MSDMEITAEDKTRIAAVVQNAVADITALGLAPRDGRDSLVALQLVMLNVIGTIFEDPFQQPALEALAERVGEQLKTINADTIGQPLGTA